MTESKAKRKIERHLAEGLKVKKTHQKDRKQKKKKERKRDTAGVQKAK